MGAAGQFHEGGGVRERAGARGVPGRNGRTGAAGGADRECRDDGSSRGVRRGLPGNAPVRSDAHDSGRGAATA